MKDYGRTRSTVEPKQIVVDEHSVWVHSNITKLSEELPEEQGFEGFEFDMVQYDKDEYILLMSDKNTDLEKQLIDTQIALCEVYELMV